MHVPSKQQPLFPIVPKRETQRGEERMASSSPSFLLCLLLSTIAATATTSQSLPTTFPRTAVHGSALKQTLNTHKPKPKLSFKTQFFPQILDHFTFTPKGSIIFYQRYLINAQYWCRGAPIFVYTGNEGDIEWFATNTGFLLDIAPTFRAMLVFIEVLYCFPSPLKYRSMGVVSENKENTFFFLGFVKT